MFVQTIRGKTSDAAAVRACLDQWMRDLQPGAAGWLGTTSGVTEQGDVFALVRFASESDALANSARPEQGRWWAEMEKTLDGAAIFHDSTNVTTEHTGDLDSAGFVQVILGKSSNPERARELMTSDLPARAQGRPDILGSVSVVYGDGGYAYVLYFTTEAEARAGEKKEMPPEVKALMEEIMSLAIGPPEYLDLTTPWLDSPR